jgi:hypothetical protein
MLTDRIDGQNLNTSLPPGVSSACQRFTKKAQAPAVNQSVLHVHFMNRQYENLDKYIIPRSIAACPHNLQFDRFYTFFAIPLALQPAPADAFLA